MGGPLISRKAQVSSETPRAPQKPRQSVESDAGQERAAKVGFAREDVCELPAEAKSSSGFDGLNFGASILRALAQLAGFPKMGPGEPGISIADAVARATQPPRNSPAAFLRSEGPTNGKPTVVCVGDSITHGRVSANYVDRVEEALGGQANVVNAGVNSETSFDVLKRLDAVLACKPTLVTVLIGTNDAKDSATEKKARDTRRQRHMPEVPSLDFYQRNLRTIVERLQKEGGARVVVISPPPITEDVGDPLYARSRAFAEAARDIARETGADYVPLFEAMDEVLKAQPSRASPTSDDRSLWEAIVAHCLYGNSFEEISKHQGYSLHTDYLHLNDRGAGMVAERVLPYVSELRAAASVPQP